MEDGSPGCEIRGTVFNVKVKRLLVYEFEIVKPIPNVVCSFDFVLVL